MKRLLILAAVMALALGVPAQTAQTKAKEKTLKLQNAELEKKQRELKGDLRGVVDKKLDVRSEVKRFDALASAANDRLDEVRDKLREGRERQKELLLELDRASGRMAQNKDKLRARIRSIYMSGDESMLLVLLGSRDAADFASRKFLLERIATRDEELFLEVRELHDEIKVKKDEQDKLVAGILELEKESKSKLAELNEARAEKAALLEKYQKEQAVYENLIDELEEESRKLESEVRRLQAQYMQSGGPVIRGSGRFVWPARGRISSKYGYRVHPIFRTRRMHSGLDIAAPTGTPIVSADSGRVIFAGWRGGYGNTVIVDHGGGTSTLYGHCSRIFVKTGQSVSQGQRIAAIGSTGNSTGPHLHFEVRINGSPRNPQSYL